MLVARCPHNTKRSVLVVQRLQSLNLPAEPFLPSCPLGQLSFLTFIYLIYIYVQIVTHSLSFVCNLEQRIRDCLVSIVTGLRAGLSGFDSRPGQGLSVGH
jgi:hypothetical protein